MGSEDNGVLLHGDYRNIIERLSCEQVGVLVKALFAKTGPGVSMPSDMDFPTEIAFKSLLPGVLRFQESTSRKRAANVENGKKGGRPRKARLQESSFGFDSVSGMEPNDNSGFQSENHMDKPKNPSVSGENHSVLQTNPSESNPNETNQEEQVGVRRSSPIRTGMPSKAHPAYRGFCAVWQVYPLQQGEDDAWRMYARLYDDGVLPESYALRDAVIEMAENDVRWKDGKMPLMANWLDGHRWKDRPLRAQEEKPAAKKQRPAWMLPVPTGPAPERRPAKRKEVEDEDGCIIDLE